MPCLWAALGWMSLVMVACATRTEPPDYRALDEDLLLHEVLVDSVYYLHRWGDTNDVDGLLDARVTRLGWNEHCLWVECIASAGAGERGWMVIDRDRNLVFGPYSILEVGRSARDACYCDSLTWASAREVFAELPLSEDSER